MNICRCCNREVKAEALFSMSNMPDSAQGFLDKEQLAYDKGCDIDLFQCPYCGLVQLFCEPVSYYKEVIRATSVSDEMRIFRKKQFSDLSERLSLSGKKAIEYGCGKGDYLEVFKDAVDCDLYGTEFNDASVEICKNNGLNVLKVYLDDNKVILPEGPFDFFFIMNFMEHMPYPSVFLEAALNNLSDDGYGLIEVPNSDMIFEERLYSELISDHLMYFTKETLIRLLSINGFEVIECNVIWHNYIISALVRKRKHLDGCGFRAKLDMMNSLIANYMIARSEYGLIAVWGAGHQAIANMGVLDIRQYISCVIDSAPFKQNKYIPSSHLLIVSPDILKEGKIKTVLVMGGSYSDEIAAYVIMNYPDVKCCILRESSLEEMN
jgi:SAM-dependent methyltransferase